MPRTSERAETTRATLISVARQLFADEGFAGTSIEEILQRADVSRGALYHHFKSKEDLFREVYEAIEVDLTGRILAKAMKGGGDALTILARGLTTFLEECLEPEVQRIVLLEGPTVLGWESWHEIDEKYGYGVIKAAVEEAIAEGLVDQKTSAEALSHALLGVLIQLGCVVARAPDPKRARREMDATITRLIDGLRTR